MQIKRLRLSGFKSFVDPAELRIEPGLTGIVGPNGCGKSNLLEALRWTMGEGSAKSLRGAGMDDVIFAGTATRPQRDFAEVSLLAEIAGEETEVVRRIERGEGSAYRIDGRDVRARDLALLFADAATGAHSPALVSQGRIGAVIAARPGERRAMLEEAAGIAGLHVRRRDAEARLRATEANLARLHEVIADQQARASALRRQARAAERYRLLTAGIRIAEARLIFARWRDAAAAADAARAVALEAEMHAVAAAEAQRAAAAYLGRAAATLATARGAAQAARDAANDLTQRLAGLRGELVGIVRRIAEIGHARAQLADDRAREGMLASDAADALARLDTEIATLETRIAEGAARSPALEAALIEAERTGREAEVGLAQAMAAQAGEAADARVAGAALAAGRARAARAAHELGGIDREIATIGDLAPLHAARAAAATARGAALRHAESARDAIAAADAAERSAVESRERALARRASAAADCAALDGEAAALTRATQAGGRDRMLDRVTPAPGCERALAVAIGDDLEAGLDAAGERYWAGAGVLPDDPPAPEGTTPLAAMVDAPAALARRLAQVFVAETDSGQPLAVGQRLVTRAGALRRWDGYVARHDGAAAAERLERLNRLRAIAAARPAAARALETAAEVLLAADADIVATRRAAADARRDLDGAETRMRDAARGEDRAAAAIERAGRAGDELALRRTRIAIECDEAARDMTQSEAAVAALPEGSATRARVAALSGAADAARARVAVAAADVATAERLLAQVRERLATARAEARGWRTRSDEAARRGAELDRRAAALDDESAVLEERPAAIEAGIRAAETAHDARRGEAERALAEEAKAEAGVRAAEATAGAAAEALGDAREARAGLAERAGHHEQRRIELGRLSGERFQCPPPLLPEHTGFDGAAARSPVEESLAHDRLLADRERIGPVNLVAEAELAELEAASAGNAAERDELAQAVNRLRGSIGTLNREGRQRLLAAFEAVDRHFRRLFTTLFDGGSAHLALVDSDDPLEAGLEIMAQPPGKKLQSLTLLSGGEQALTAVALIFGLFLTNPAPICVLDEVDAPLDDANIERFCDLLDAMTRETATRYLIVTHNAVTMSRMHRLFGVTMIERGVSRLVSVDLGGAETLLAAE